MRQLSAIVFFAVALWAMPLCTSANSAPQGQAVLPAAMLDQANFAAKGVHEAILTVPVFGRYAITVTSAQGTALQLVDQMAGPGDIHGITGKTDGRIDAFLDRGSYKIRLMSDAHGSGQAKISVTPFTELQPQPLQLVENKPVQAELGDMQQLSWWIRVPRRGSYSFEAGGRYLTDLRLWQNGGWILGPVPRAGESDAEPGQPLGLRQLTAKLEPGLYRLTAYGGAGLPWSSNGNKPFMLRWGVPALSDAGRSTHTESRLGIDRFLVPGTVTELRLVIDHPEQAEILARPYSADTMFQTDGDDSAGVSKTSRDPVAELQLAAPDRRVPWLVTVTYKPGGSYRLEALNTSGNSTAVGPLANTTDPYTTLLAVTLPGNPDDEIDPGFLLIDGTQRVAASDVIELDTALPWRRHFNLLGPRQTFLHTSRNVDLRVDGSGAKADFIVDRFLTNVPADAVVPAPQPSGGIWKLTPGYYVLSAQPLPDGLGVLTMSLYAKGGKPPVTNSPRLPAAFFPDIDIDPQSPDTLFNSLDPAKQFGVTQLALPALLAQPLSLELGPRAAVHFPIAVAEDSQLTVTAASGEALPFSLDGKPASSAELRAGTYELGITGSGSANQVITVSLAPERLLQTIPLSAMPPAEMAQPVFPPLRPGQPDFINLAKGQTVNFALPVGQGSLFRFETTGLLETGGTVRTRTNPLLMQAEGNGVGRNFLLQPYLREGDYQVSVQAQGATTGHAGVTVTQTPLLDAGILTPDLPARMTLQPGTAAIYHFHVSTSGSWHILTLGLGHSFAMRLEDAQGWPLIVPGGTADATLDFSPGDYRMILLPGTVENRAVTMLQAVPPLVTYSGHGAFAVAFGQDMANRWMEPAPGQPRRPDVWSFSLPSTATVTLGIDKTMRAEIFAEGVSASLGASNAGVWQSQLPAGHYRIETSSVTPDNRLDYTLNVGLRELVAGQSRDITAPASIPISLGGSPQYEISSFGGADVRAELRDAAGNLVAENDDRANDWNFLIAGSFAPGAYWLQVDPVGTSDAATKVSVTVPVAIDGPALQPGVTADLTDGLVHFMPIPALPAGALLLAGATAPVPVGLALEMQRGDGTWQALANSNAIDPYLAVPVSQVRHYRLGVWPADHGSTPIAVTVVAVDLAPADPSGLMTLRPVALGARQIGIFGAAISRPELLQPASPDDALQWSTADDVAVAHDPSGTIAAAGGFVWLLEANPGQLVLSHPDPSRMPVRLTLAAGQSLMLPLDGAPPQGAVLWQIQGQGLQPGVAVTDASQAIGQDMALGGDNGMLTSAFAVQTSPMAQPVLHLWQATRGGGSLPLSLRSKSFPAPGPLALRTGDNDATLAPGGALQAMLAPGWKRLSLNLPAGVVAVLSSEVQQQAVIAGNGAVPDVLESDATQLLLLNPTKDATPLNIVLQPEDKPSLVLALGGMLTHYSPIPAVLHVAIMPGPATRLRIAGSATDVTVLGSDGNVTHGEAARSVDAVALVTVKPGLAIVSADGAAPPAKNSVEVSAPGSVPLAGDDLLIKVMPGPARLISFTTDTPVLLRDETTGLPQLCPAGAALNLFQPEGVALPLYIHDVDGGSLSGRAAFGMRGAIPITDGLGPKYFVGPGQARLFTFSLERAQAIGVGVRGAVDDASIRLLGPGGKDFGSGVVHMESLPRGSYYLVAELPQTAAATVIQPALVGLTVPDNGPPPDVQDSYRALAAAPQN